MIYLLITNIALAIGFALFQFSFRNLTFFQWNRCYLIGMVLVSILIPIGIYIDLTTIFQSNDIMMSIHLGVIDSIIVYTGEVERPLYLTDVLSYIYWAGVGGSILFTAYRLWQLRNTFQKQDAYSSFSFFRKIVIGSGIKEAKAIEAHERVHVREGHSYDIVLMELVSIFNWFNPIVYLIRKELKFQHECIADEICSTDKVLYAELLLAHAMRTDVNALRHEFSNQSFLKKRIMMLFKNKSTNRKKLLYLSTFPLIAIVALSTLVFNTSKAKEIVNVVEKGVDDVKVPLFKERANLTAPSGDVDEIENHKQELFETKNYSDTVAVPVDVDKFIAVCKKQLLDNGLLDKYDNTALVLSFTVNPAGQIKDLNVANGHKEILPEVKEVFKNLPNWKPAIKNGKPISSEASFMIIMSNDDLAVSSNVERVKLSEPEKDEIRTSVLASENSQSIAQADIIPEPSNGMAAFRKWIGNNYKYPQEAINAGIKGTMQISFIIEKDGSLSDIKAVRDLGYGTGEAVVNLLKTSEKWSPKIENGKAVRSQYVLPIKIDLSRQ